METKADEMKWSEDRMQYALTRSGSIFDFRRYAMVPNVSWGLGLNHEADLLCLSKSRVFHEVEIKVTISDLRADRKKLYGHYSPFIKHLWFAIPEEMGIDKALQFLPEHAGLVVVSAYVAGGKCKYRTKIHRRPRPKRRIGWQNIKSVPLEKVEQFLRLGVLRMWTDTKRFSDYDSADGRG